MLFHAFALWKGIPPMDKKYMRLAINLAKKGAGYTAPNPLVGAVIVKNDKIIGQGFHSFMLSATLLQTAEVVEMTQKARLST